MKLILVEITISAFSLLYFLEFWLHWSQTPRSISSPKNSPRNSGGMNTHGVEAWTAGRMSSIQGAAEPSQPAMIFDLKQESEAASNDTQCKGPSDVEAPSPVGDNKTLALQQSVQTTTQMVTNTPSKAKQKQSHSRLVKTSEAKSGPNISGLIDSWGGIGEKILPVANKTVASRLTGRPRPPPLLSSKTVALPLPTTVGSASDSEYRPKPVDSSSVKFKPYHTAHRQLFNLSLLRTSTHEWERDKCVGNACMP